ncbi:acyl-CoA-binding protein, putative [Eimeria praecox]|uniref:Acyl-CoA-binding protein, putative n=1 Tax=Eimeria praecox TaxID=51316 RepID=U6H2K7_9EIME|nr:acyl-CoA-binding protein, putative [Eimeria praecox]
MARPGERTPAILVGLGFASAIVLAAILLKRFHSRGRNREGQASSSDHTALPAECALKEDDLTKVSETAERFDEAREAVEVAAKSLAAWNAHKGLSSDEAKAKYVRLALQLGLIRPPGEAQGSAGRAGGRRLGPVHSRPTLTTEDGNIAGSKGDRFCCMVAKGNVDAVQRALAGKLIVKWSQDPSLVYATGEGGMTGFHFAADRGHADIARMLLAQGADVNLQDDCGETPLHVAIAAEQEELISMLVEAGTDTSLKNSEGKSCAELLEEEEELRHQTELQEAKEQGK